MAEMFSTGLRNALYGRDGLRRLFADCVIEIYSGSAPATADAAYTGTKLCRITKSSGTVSATERSIAQQYHVPIHKFDIGSTFYIALTQTDANSTGTYTAKNLNLTVTGAAGLVGRIGNMAVEFEEANPGIRVMAYGLGGGTTAGAGALFQSNVPGLTFTITGGASGAGTTGVGAQRTAFVSQIANVRSDACQFGVPAAGVLTKVTETWSGTNLATGTAGYGRIVMPDDTQALSTTQLRIQGAVGTSGAEFNFYTLNFQVDAVTTISTGTITFPAG